MLVKVNDKNPVWFLSAIFIFLAVIGLSYFLYFTAPEEATPSNFEADSNPPIDGVVRSPDEKIPDQQIVRGEEELDAYKLTINAVTKNAAAVGDDIQDQNQESYNVFPPPPWPVSPLAPVQYLVRSPRRLFVAYPLLPAQVLLHRPL